MFVYIILLQVLHIVEYMYVFQQIIIVILMYYVKHYLKQCLHVEDIQVPGLSADVSD